jgi:cation transport ATPase
MKKLFFLLVTGVMITAAAHAQQKALQTLRIKTSVECDMCKKRIESYFKREPAVDYVNVNYHNKIVTVRYYPTRTNPPYIRYAIANLGYDADTVKANPDFYAELPACCKKGGMAKLKEAQKRH